MWKTRTRIKTMHEIQIDHKNPLPEMQSGIPLRTSMRIERPEPTMGRQHHPVPKGKRWPSQSDLATGTTHKAMAAKRRIQTIRQGCRNTTKRIKRKRNVQRSI